MDCGRIDWEGVLRTRINLDFQCRSCHKRVKGPIKSRAANLVRNSEYCRHRGRLRPDKGSWLGLRKEGRR